MDHNPYGEPWMQYATCRSIGTEAFYPPKGSAHVEWNKLRSVCRTGCPVLLQCADWIMRTEQGLDHKRRFGLTAGMSPLQREKYEPQWLAERGAA